jgi:hypothetical protein
MTFIERLLPDRILYVKLMKNKIEVKHIQSGKIITKTAEKAFSNDRLIIAYYENAESLMKSIIHELFIKKTFDRPNFFLLQPIDKDITEITPVESRIYQDFAAFSGASKVKIYPTQENLTDEEVYIFLGKKK